ncbi:uncharacterized protein VTP21DRAFT_11748 [Calcarisporiella thermophila]|uniref:uncharacterized protein n=1 Tax=Calcarisporiella thermophila TaxID=911321 RepID=UPI003744B1CB
MNEPYDLLKLHTTAVIFVHENQRSVSAFSLALGLQKFSGAALTKLDTCGPWSLHPSGQPQRREDIHLPLQICHSGQAERLWFWLTDWEIDDKNPQVGHEGWQYSKSFDDPDEIWSPHQPSTGGSWVRRRRWFRVMKRRIELTEECKDANFVTSEPPQKAHVIGIIEADEQPELNLPSVTIDSANDAISQNRESLNATLAPMRISPGTVFPATSTSVTTSVTHAHALSGTSSFDDDSQSAKPRKESSSRSSTPPNDYVYTSFLRIPATTQYPGNTSVHDQSAMPQELQYRESGIPSNLLDRVIWESDQDVIECRVCNRKFNLWIRRHHCRRCGRVVCDKCSSSRAFLKTDEIAYDPSNPPYPLPSSGYYRICDDCYQDKQLTHHSSLSSPEIPTSSTLQRTHSNSSLSECPVCGTRLADIAGGKDEQEQHLKDCLEGKVGSGSVGVKYLVSKLADGSMLVGEECPICFEEFIPGDVVARLTCLCTYHRHCIHSWFSRAKECPVHYT